MFKLIYGKPIGRKALLVISFFVPFLFLNGCWFKNSTEPQRTSGWEPLNNGIETLTVQSIAVAQQKPDVMYLGTLDGLYKTKDGGGQWSRIDETLTGHDIKCIALDPNDSERLFVGTWGKGVFKSVNGGMSWNKVWQKGQDPRIYSLYLTSGARPILLAGTENGLYRSEDFGETWKLSFVYGSIQAIAAQPDKPTRIFIGVRSHGIFKSDDGGVNWQKMNNGLFQSGDGVATANSFVFHPQNSSEIYISTGWVDLYKSIDGGENWKQFAYDLNEKKVVSLTVDPRNSQKLWAATLANGVFRSKDGGETWQQFNAGLESVETKVICAGGGQKSTVYLGTVGKGLYRYIDE